ncbi:MAG: hypothetical protein QOI78_4780 [Actinomycetota bacterium]|nr:hypothetical protein [Actinomycetota bacterium]
MIRAESGAKTSRSVTREWAKNARFDDSATLSMCSRGRAHAAAEPEDRQFSSVTKTYRTKKTHQARQNV